MNDAGIQLLQVNETRLMGLLFCLYLAASVLQNFAFMRRSYSIHHGLWQVGYVLRLTLRPPAVPARIFPVLLLAFAASLIAYGLMAQRIWGLAALALYLLTIPSIRTMHLIHQKSNLCPIVLTILLISSEYHSPLFYVDRASSGDAVS
jgi:hypothetical protein